MDLRDVRRIFQFQVPTSLTVLKQRYGRAGRDGLPAIIILLVQPAVYQKQKPTAKKKQPAASTRKAKTRGDRARG